MSMKEKIRFTLRSKKFHLLNWKSQLILALKVSPIGFLAIPNTENPLCDLDKSCNFCQSLALNY